MRIVLDTNVLVSALISPTGPPAQLLAALQRREFTWVISDAQISELQRVLRYDKLRPLIRPPEAEALLASIDALAEVVAGPLPAITLTNDPDDNIILATAIAGRADLLVTGDQRHLLSLRAPGIAIATARDALKLLAR